MAKRCVEKKEMMQFRHVIPTCCNDKLYLMTIVILDGNFHLTVYSVVRFHSVHCIINYMTRKYTSDPHRFLVSNKISVRVQKAIYEKPRAYQTVYFATWSRSVTHGSVNEKRYHHLRSTNITMGPVVKLSMKQSTLVGKKYIAQNIKGKNITGFFSYCKCYKFS